MLKASVSLLDCCMMSSCRSACGRTLQVCTSQLLAVLRLHCSGRSTLQALCVEAAGILGISST